MKSEKNEKGKKKLTLDKTILKNITIRSGLKAGNRSSGVSCISGQPNCACIAY
jgi:hypothetical protein